MPDAVGDAPGGALGAALNEAAEVMDRLWRAGGWETTQTHDSLRPYLLEETYELLDAIQSGDPAAIREEIGDLLLQVLFHSRIAEAAGEFTVDDVAADLVAKLVHRSPHLADDLDGPIDIAEQERAWEARKAEEKTRASCLDGVASSQPAGSRAEKILERSGRAGVPVRLVPAELAEAIVAAQRADNALRAATEEFAACVRDAELRAREDGRTELSAEGWVHYWPAPAR